MKNGKYGFFIASIVMLVCAAIGVAYFAAFCFEILPKMDALNNGLAIFLALFVTVFLGLSVGAGTFFVSVLGLLFAALALKRAEKKVYLTLSVILCVLHALIISVTLIPTVYMMCFMIL